MHRYVKINLGDLKKVWFKEMGLIYIAIPYFLYLENPQLCYYGEIL